MVQRTETIFSIFFTNILKEKQNSISIKICKTFYGKPEELLKSVCKYVRNRGVLKWLTVLNI